MIDNILKNISLLLMYFMIFIFHAVYSEEVWHLKESSHHSDHSVDHFQTVINQNVTAGGFGGNVKIGKLIYDGAHHLPTLSMMRNETNQTCFLQNQFVTIYNYNNDEVMNFPCSNLDATYHLYWNSDFDTINGGYSPANDALFAGLVIKNMYETWYGMPVLKNSNGTPRMIHIVVHFPHYDNAFWDGYQMTFGDGEHYFYPLTSIDVAAHEISHGFTEQHANLVAVDQPGALSESFSDMAAQAAQVYAYGKNNWQLGADIFKEKNKAIGYMDLPSKDCQSRPAAQCSIDDASHYTNQLDAHYASGVYNRFFYLLSTSDHWDVKKAFAVMVYANAFYWTSETNFNEATCGILKAATSLHDDTKAIHAAFKIIKVDDSHCV